MSSVCHREYRITMKWAITTAFFLFKLLFRTVDKHKAYNEIRASTNFAVYSKSDEHVRQCALNKGRESLEKIIKERKVI